MLIKEINYIYSDDDETRLNEIRAVTGWPLPNPIAESTNPAIRFENYLTKKLIEKEKLTPKFNKFPEGNINAKREDFGESKAGEMAYEIIRDGAECVLFIDVDKNICGKLGIGTVDVDASTTVDFFPFCSEEHAKILTEQLETGIKKDGRSTYPAKNGFGRELAIFETQET